jgi:hypothetical protein
MGVKTLYNIGNYDLNALLTIALVNALQYANPHDIQLPDNNYNLDAMNNKIMTILSSNTLLTWGKTVAGNVIKQKLEGNNPPHMFWELVLHAISLELGYSPFTIKWALVKELVKESLLEGIPIVMKAIFNDEQNTKSLYTVLTIKELIESGVESYCVYTDPRGNPFNFYKMETPDDGINITSTFDELWEYTDIGGGLHIGAIFVPVSKVLSPYVVDPIVFDADGDAEKLLEIITENKDAVTTEVNMLNEMGQTFDATIDFATFEKGLIGTMDIQLQHETCYLYHTLMTRILSLTYGTGLTHITLDSHVNNSII